MWLGWPVHVVEDTPEQLITYTAPGAEFGFVDGEWPTEDGRNPWFGRTHWQGLGCLMLQRTGEHHAVWHFWGGEDRSFVGWYLNLQTAIVRHRLGYDTWDLELDIVVYPDGRWQLKDEDLLEQRIDEGRFSSQLVHWVRSYGEELTARLDREGPWWDLSWTAWQQPDSWRDARLPAAWDRS